MAYGGAVAMCSGEALLAETDYLGLTLLGSSSVAILILIMMNNRGKRTMQALFVSALGITSIVLTSQKIMGSSWHYMGSGLLFLGIWTNGSLYYLLRKAKQSIKRQFIKIPTE